MTTVINYNQIKNAPINVLDYGANTIPGTTDMTAAIQAAHTAAVAAAYSEVVFPAGTYKFTSLTWSPSIPAVAIGEVILTTALASGNALTVSDAYGGPVLVGKTTLLFTGNFRLINSNASNTAYGIFLGGATVANSAAFCKFEGMIVEGFKGGALQIGYNSIIHSFHKCWFKANLGSQISFAASVTNIGENIVFDQCVFSGSDGGTPAGGPLININNPASIDITFISCSADYLSGMNKTGNTAGLLTVTWLGGHIEWDQVALTHLENDSTSTWNIDGAIITPTALSGWPTYVVSKTTGAGTTRFTNIKYILPGALNKLHQLVSATSRGSFDYTPNYQNGNYATTFLDATGGLTIPVGYDGIAVTQISNDTSVIWSGTIGDGTKTMTYTRVGNRVDIYIKLVWGTTTTHPATVQTFNLPYTSNANAGGTGAWWGNDFGTSARTGMVRIAPNASSMTLWNDATATQVSDSVPMTWANQDSIEILATFFI